MKYHLCRIVKYTNISISTKCIYSRMCFITICSYWYIRRTSSCRVSITIIRYYWSFSIYYS
nr:MAG TPA: hypothetical protein [Crassvirales sp.]